MINNNMSRMLTVALNVRVRVKLKASQIPINTRTDKSHYIHTIEYQTKQKSYEQTSYYIKHHE